MCCATCNNSTLQQSHVNMLCMLKDAIWRHEVLEGQMQRQNMHTLATEAQTVTVRRTGKCVLTTYSSCLLEGVPKLIVFLGGSFHLSNHGRRVGQQH